ncbi:MAG TPA: NADH:ubiquinone oxidoreductase [Coriobacteriia bacterium]
MAPRVVVLSLASDFGCQVQLTNMEDHLLEVLGLMDLSYWQLASSGHMPAAYDVAIVEGAVTTGEHVEFLKDVRSKAAAVIAIGACANTGGIPALARGGDLEGRYASVYGTGGVAVAPGRLAPAPVGSVIAVDYHVPGCPIDQGEFLRVLSRVLLGLSDRIPDGTMCASCKVNENVCFYESGTVCLGLVTRSGCGAKCPTLGRPCAGCRGVAPDANLASARDVLARYGCDEGCLTSALRVYNTAEEVLV